jgi:mRNA-degrading endonuclease HigB of HigAB toxin-antitoxin module
MSDRIRGRLTDAVIALGLFFGYVTALLRTVQDLGYARDEGFYFQAASSYGRWFELYFKDRKAALVPQTVDSFWNANPEHPGLIKGLFALSNLFLQKKHHLFAMEGTSYRFPAMVLGGLALVIVYLWGAEARGRAAGLFAALFLALMPRFFFQAHLACFDVPIVAMWTLTAYAYWKSLRAPSLVWPVLTGIAFGLALDTKHNAWFLPFVVVAHIIGREVIHQLDARQRGVKNADFAPSRLRSLTALGAMALFGPLVFVTLWPHLWHDTLARFRWYASFHLNHEYYNMEFLGKNYWSPPMPRGYAWVMTATTVPTITLLLFLVGLAVRARARLSALAFATLGNRWAAVARWTRDLPAPRFDPGSTDLLWLLGLVVNYAAWTSPNTPIFGGTKHWMTAYPFLALFAGCGFAAVVRAVRRELLRYRRRFTWALAAGRPALPVTALAGVAVIAAPAAETLHAHPWGLSAYTPLAGGAPGAATLGLNRSFWGYTTGAIVPELNREVPKRGSVYIHDTAGPSWDMLATDGRLRRDIRGVWSVAGADFALYHHEKHMRGQEFQAWVAYGTVRPDIIAGLDGVPVILVYKAPTAR